jgi:hypothetical protein
MSIEQARARIRCTSAAVQVGLAAENRSQGRGAVVRVAPGRRATAGVGGGEVGGELCLW